MITNTAKLFELFPVKHEYLYFNFASDGPLSSPSRAAIVDAIDEMTTTGQVAIVKQMTVIEDLRHELSVLFKSDKRNFAYVRNTSEGVLMALLAMDIREDENYIVAVDAFPTTVKMMESNCKGQMRRVEINGPISLVDQVRGVMDNRTRAVVLDWAHYFTGKVIDIEPITQLCRSKNIFTVIDGIQAAGALSLDLDNSGIDFFTAGGNKWLISPQGSGFIYVSPKVWEKCPRRAFGWLGYNWCDFSDFTISPDLLEGAAVLEYGTRPYISAVGFRESLRIINSFGIHTIENHNRELKEIFLEGILKKGCETIPHAKTTSIIPFRFPGKDSRILLEKLDRSHAKMTLRNGYIRAAIHFINHRDEIERILDLL